MCGIVGICSFATIQREDIRAVEQYKRTMMRRGPDADGLWTDNENVVLGFRRLAIQDLNPRSNQPFVTRDGLHVLVFNGEIYNVNELRRSLSSYVHFETTSDTEVLLQLLVIKGIDYTLAKIDGIFAFAYYNLVSKELFLARDRAGVKPLYYGVVGQRLVFSSQYDHLLNDAHLGVQAINGSALEHYFELGYVPEGEGFLHNTFLLPHGHYLKWACNSLSLATYFQYPMVVQPMGASLETSISESVRQQLISDVPVGTFLSGGIDSTLVTYHAKPHLSKLDTFNIASIDKDYDESGYAAEFSKFFLSLFLTILLCLLCCFRNLPGKG
jgi:asparagine synthase (glutamine-hydrolysing)